MARLQLQALVPSEGNPKGYETPSSTGFYNMDIIRNTQVFFYPENLHVATNSTTAKTIVKSTRIYHSDPKLRNTNELWRFFVSNLRRPYMLVRIEGTHKQVTNTMDIVYASVVTDFSMQIDVSKYVNPRWSQMVARPFKKGVAPPTVREILKEYARCKSTSKEISLKKMVGWNFDELFEMLVDLVRSAGYQSEVTITYLVPDYKVAVAHSKSASEMGILSWLMSELVWPLSKYFKNRLVCEYSMKSSVQDFFNREANRIYNAVRRRRKEEYMFALESKIECDCFQNQCYR